MGEGAGSNSDNYGREEVMDLVMSAS